MAFSSFARNKLYVFIQGDVLVANFARRGQLPCPPTSSVDSPSGSGVAHRSPALTPSAWTTGVPVAHPPVAPLLFIYTDKGKSPTYWKAVFRGPACGAGGMGVQTPHGAVGSRHVPPATGPCSHFTAVICRPAPGRARGPACGDTPGRRAQRANLLIGELRTHDVKAKAL